MPVIRDELFRACHQTACWIVRSVPAFDQVLGEMAERPGIGDDAGRPPSLEFPVVSFEYLRREPKTVEGFDVGDEAIDAVAQTFGRRRIEMMAPEISDPRADGQPEPSHKRVSAALPPTSRFRAHPDLDRRSARPSRGVSAQPVGWDGAGYKSPAGSMHILAPQRRQPGEIIEAEIRSGIKPDPVKQLVVVNRLAIRPA